MFYIKGEGISDQFDHLKFIPVGVSITHFRKKWAKAGSLENFSFEVEKLQGPLCTIRHTAP